MPAELNLIQLIAVYALPVVLAITLHEAAHGYVAQRFGDDTARVAGRVTLNPVRHVDPFGTVILPLVLLGITKLLGTGGLLLGWAKPVPVNFAKLRNPKRDMLWVAAAGPLSNLLMAILWTGMLRVALAMPDSTLQLPLALMGTAGLFINVLFLALNLLPLPPLDGGRMLVSLLPYPLARAVAGLERYGFAILFVLLFTGVLGFVLWPVIGMLVALIAVLFGVPAAELSRLGNLIS